MELSVERANSVREYLISRGVPENRITARGKGQDSPIADNDTRRRPRRESPRRADHRVAADGAAQEPGMPQRQAARHAGAARVAVARASAPSGWRKRENPGPAERCRGRDSLCAVTALGGYSSSVEKRMLFRSMPCSTISLPPLRIIQSRRWSRYSRLCLPSAISCGRCMNCASVVDDVLLAAARRSAARACA